MDDYRNKVEEAVTFLRDRLREQPGIGVILGTGLGGIAQTLEEIAAFPYTSIPHYPASTVKSHAGKLILGRLGGKTALVMQGRLHLYEGYSAREIAFPIRVMARLGVKTLVISNAAGGLNPHFFAGDLMLITDHINLTGHNPLIGPNVDEWGERFPGMTEPYDRRLRQLAAEVALAEKIPLHPGVYAGVTGPSLETAAETRFIRAMGADAVGMSTLMEVITAVHMKLKILAFSAITNVNLADAYEATTLEAIIAAAEAAGPKLARIMTRTIEQL